jgi:hypothetical protein
MGRTKPGVQNRSQPYPLLLGRFRPDFVQSRSAAVKLHGHLYQMLALAELHAGRSYGSLSDVVTAALGRANVGIAVVPVALPILNCLTY